MATTGREITAKLSETEQRNLGAVADVLPYWNRHDLDGVLSFYAEEINWHNVALEETYQGKAEVRAYLSRLLVAFPDLTFGVTHRIARGDNVAEQWRLRGTHLGEFLGIPPTGRRVDIPGMSMVELKAGKFVRDEFYFDSGIVLRQIGLMPPIASIQSPPGKALLWLAVNRVPILIAAAGLVMMAGVLGLLRKSRRRA
jgi:steroid delta-isomerase-like uncharacterized protein